jgi:hypothetical protein
MYVCMYVSGAYTGIVFRGALLRLLAYCTLSALFGGGGSIFLFIHIFSSSPRAQAHFPRFLEKVAALLKVLQPPVALLYQ